MMTPTKMKLRVRKREGGAKPSQRLLATEASPDSKCPICLDRFNNVASLDRCLHRFCFRCIHEWSKNKAECPLCKQPFCSIFHSVRAENDFKEFVLTPMENGPAATAAPTAGQADGGGADPAGRARRTRSARGRERRSRRRSNPAPSAASSPGVRLEGMSGTEHERGVQRVMLRLTERQRSRAAERSLRRLRDRDVVAFRRALYRTGVRVRSTWDAGRPRDVSAVYLRRNPACLRRLLPWLQRELTVLYGSHGSLVSIVQHIIMSRITHHDMDHDSIRDELRPFLLARTDHFLHELVNFARSTLSIEAYDQQAVYECTAPSYEEGSASDSSIIAISEDDDNNNTEDADITEDTIQDVVPPVPMATGGESSLSQSAWDDETPGPSYSTLFPSPSQSQADGAEPATASAQTDEVGSVCGGPGHCEEEEEEQECMIVGYVKPMAERTPELVQLSSDSSEEEEEKEVVATETPAATVTKTEPSLSQVQAPPSSHSYLSPLSPSSYLYPSPSCSPRTHTQHTSGHCSSSAEREAGREVRREAGRPPRMDTREHTQRHSSRARSRARSCSRVRSRSSSESSVISECSITGRTHKRFGSSSRHGEPSSQVEPRGRSPTVSIPSDSSSASWELPCSKMGRGVSTREHSSPSSVCWDSPGRDGECRRTRERRRQRWRERDTERKRSPSPPRAHPLPSKRRRDARRRHGHRERRRHSDSVSSSGGSSSDPPRPEKPAGKRKYKTRHLERAARRQDRGAPGERRTARSPAERPWRGPREHSRSPSVEIVFERRPADTRLHTDQWRRRRKRHKRRSRREQSSPAVITIDSDSDLDLQGNVPEVTDLPAAGQDPAEERQVEGHVLANQAPLSEPQAGVSASPHLAVPHDSPTASPCECPAASPDCPLQLEHCVVDVVNSHLPDSPPPKTFSNLHQDATMPTETPPSDTRLLESILQELEDILPETTPALNLQGEETVPHGNQSKAGPEAFNTDHTVFDSERDAPNTHEHTQHSTD